MLSQKYKTLLLVLLVIFFDYISIGLVYPLFSSMLFAHDFLLLPLSASQAERGFYLGLLLTSMPLVLFMIAPFVGSLSDRIGRKKVIVTCTFIGVIGYLLSYVAVIHANLGLLLLSRAIIGMSASSAPVVAAVITDISEPEERTKFFGWYNMGLGLGLAAGPFVGGLLTAINVDATTKYAMPFLVSAGIVFCIAVLVQLCMQESYVPNPNVKSPSFYQKLVEIKNAFFHPKLSKIFATIGLFSFGWSFYWEFIPVTWIEAFQFTSFDIGAIYGFAAGMYALSCGLLIQPLSKFFSTDRLFSIGLIGCAIIFGLMGMIQTSVLIWILVPLQQIFISLLFPASATLIAENTGEEEQGEMQGIRQSVMSLAFAIGPLLSGALLGFSVHSPVYVGILSMLAAALVLAMRRRSINLA